MNTGVILTVAVLYLWINLDHAILYNVWWYLISHLAATGAKPLVKRFPDHLKWPMSEFTCSLGCGLLSSQKRQNMCLDIRSLGNCQLLQWYTLFSQIPMLWLTYLHFTTIHPFECPPVLVCVMFRTEERQHMGWKDDAKLKSKKTLYICSKKAEQKKLSLSKVPYRYVILPELQDHSLPSPDEKIYSNFLISWLKGDIQRRPCSMGQGCSTCLIFFFLEFLVWVRDMQAIVAKQKGSIYQVYFGYFQG